LSCGVAKTGKGIADPADPAEICRNFSRQMQYIPVSPEIQEKES